MAVGLGIYENRKETLEIRDLASIDIRLLAIPFLIGKFLLQKKFEELSERKAILESAQPSYLDFSHYEFLLPF